MSRNAELDQQSRAINALADHVRRWVPTSGTTEEELLRWAATQDDRQLIRVRNIGRKSVAWIRAHQPVSEPVIVAVECPLCAGTGRIVAPMVATD